MEDGNEGLPGSCPPRATGVKVGKSRVSGHPPGQRGWWDLHPQGPSYWGQGEPSSCSQGSQAHLPDDLLSQS